MDGGHQLLSLNEYMKKYKGCWVWYGKGNSDQHGRTKCAVYALNGGCPCNVGIVVNGLRFVVLCKYFRN